MFSWYDFNFFVVICLCDEINLLYSILNGAGCCIMPCRDLSNNKLEGDIPVNGSFSLFTPIRFFSYAISCFSHPNFWSSSPLFYHICTLRLASWIAASFVHSFANNRLNNPPPAPPPPITPTAPIPSGLFSILLLLLLIIISF